MEKHDVSEVKLQEGETKYVLRRGPQFVAGSVAAAPVAAAPVAAVPAASPAPAASGDAAPAANSGLIEIVSPTVGTFYQSPSPDEPAFVNVGDNVSPKKIVCIVEAMKVFNQIPAEVSGTIEQILLKDGDTVEFGQPIFLVRP
ncbi:UNVERIFIED_CONTAM: hypothetical protein GTU68_021516 [Idotea baltica]|nr:hypothetical protein [Idotea baltica]